MEFKEDCEDEGVSRRFSPRDDDDDDDDDEDDDECEEK